MRELCLLSVTTGCIVTRSNDVYILRSLVLTPLNRAGSAYVTVPITAQTLM